MYIDSHVHCRDEEESYKETIAHALEVARDSNVDAIFDMPNTRRPVINRQRVEERLKIAQQANIPEVFYGLYIGLTKDRKQIRHAVALTRDKIFAPHVVGLKFYAGHSVGNLGVTKLEDQAMIYETLAQEQYQGIMFIHAEKESEMNPGQFTAALPISHCFARPPKAEQESIKDQIMLTRQYNFKGKLHIAHISHPVSVKLVKEARLSGLDISCGVCPHHLLYNHSRMEKKDGLLWKMNPPLREPGAPSLLLEELRQGNIDWIETDHAPHSLEEKINHPYLSGIPGLPWWPSFAEYLRHHDFSEKDIEKITFENCRNRFNLDIKQAKHAVKDHRNDYQFPHAELQ